MGNTLGLDNTGACAVYEYGRPLTVGNYVNLKLGFIVHESYLPYTVTMAGFLGHLYILQENQDAMHQVRPQHMY